MDTLPNPGVQTGEPDGRRALNFVMKITRGCNLRCTYCYEFVHLGDHRRMSLEDLGRMFRSVAAYAEANGIGTVGFTWHGGEPFLVPVEYHLAIRALQRELLPGLEVVNKVQTNLTILTDRHVELLRAGELFDSISISFDVGGDQRVDRKGRPTTDAVLRNMQRLLDAGVPFGAICVLSRSTAGQVEAIYQFFRDINLECRLLPFYRGTNGTGDDGQALSQAEIAAALAAVFDTWIGSDNPVPVRPLDELFAIAVAAITDAPRQAYQKSEDEWVFAVGPDGNLWGISEIEDYRHRYGNVFEAPLAQVLGSEARQSTLAAADARAASLCGACPYFGHCSGYTMADATDGFHEVVEREGCHRRMLLDHIIARMAATGMAEEIRAASGGQTTAGP